MPLVIDGRNVLGSMRKLFRPEADRYLLEEFVIPYNEVKQKKVVVVFDNMDYNSYRYNHFKIDPGITVHYTQHGIETADEWIIKMIEQSNSPEGITLVTSDRELKNIALIHHCKHLYAESFIKEVRNILGYAEEKERQDFENENRLLSQGEINDINDELLDLWG